MGHQVIYCDFCDNSVMEGRNDWECDKCMAVCNAETGYKWVKPKENEKKKKFKEREG